jgi:hypothetical protein
MLNPGDHLLKESKTSERLVTALRGKCIYNLTFVGFQLIFFVAYFIYC